MAPHTEAILLQSAILLRRKWAQMHLVTNSERLRRGCPTPHSPAMLSSFPSAQILANRWHGQRTDGTGNPRPRRPHVDERINLPHEYSYLTPLGTPAAFDGNPTSKGRSRSPPGLPLLRVSIPNAVRASKVILPTMRNGYYTACCAISTFAKGFATLLVERFTHSSDGGPPRPTHITGARDILSASKGRGSLSPNRGFVQKSHPTKSWVQAAREKSA